MKNVIGAAVIGFVAGLSIGAAVSMPSAAPSVDEVATRGVVLGKTEREAICERYCSASIADTNRHITFEVGKGGGTVVPEGVE